MACETFTIGGITGTVCYRGGRRKSKPCKVADCKRPHTRLCDFKLSNGRTCDAPLCSSHAVSIGPGVDYCPGHPQPQCTLRFSP